MSEVTRLLDASAAGDSQAATDLLPLVYDELRKLAAVKLIAEAPGHTLGATALVHEAYLRLVGTEQSFRTRTAFLRAATVAMRRILVDHARTRMTEKRGGARTRVELVDAPTPTPDVDLVDLDDALVRLATIDHQAAELIQLRYFTGLTIPQSAEVLGISPRSADRLWAFARAWLYRELSGEKLA